MEGGGEQTNEGTFSSGDGCVTSGEGSAEVDSEPGESSAEVNSESGESSAEVNSESGESTAEVDSELDSWCVGCSSPSSCPKLLRCLHTACVNCLKENASADGHAVCPKCKETTLAPLSSGWIDGLPTNHVLKRQLMRRAEKLKSKARGKRRSRATA